MHEIIPLLMCLNGNLNMLQVRQLGQVILAMLCSGERITMQGLSRWTEGGGSYRTVQRFYGAPIAWGEVHWAFIKAHLLRGGGRYVLAADEVVVSKAGKKTHGVGRFYSGLAERRIPGVSFLVLALIDVAARRSYPLEVEQLLPPDKREPALTPVEKRPPGRPKGLKNYEKAAPTLNAELTVLQRLLRSVLGRIGGLAVELVVLDGKYGTYAAPWLVRQTGLHILSRLRCDAALYRPDRATEPRRGPVSRYGEKLTYEHLEPQACVDARRQGDALLQTYHYHAYHKDFPDLLNVVVQLRTHLKTGKTTRLILFSTDLSLTPAQILDFYSLRFQIEFNFRDAKQSWGLEDFMNVHPQTVTNAVNLAFFMTNLSRVLRQSPSDPLDSILDLKARFRAYRYLSETINLLPQPPDPPLISRIQRHLARFGALKAPKPPLPAA